MCMEVSTPSKAHITLHTLPLKSKCGVSVLKSVRCPRVSIYLPRGLRGENNLCSTETGFHIILCLITYLCTLTPATVTSFNYALLFSICFAKNLPFYVFPLLAEIYSDSYFTSPSGQRDRQFWPPG